MCVVSFQSLAPVQGRPTLEPIPSSVLSWLVVALALRPRGLAYKSHRVSRLFVWNGGGSSKAVH